MRQPSRRPGTAPESPCALTDSATPSSTNGAGPHARLTARMSQLTERLQASLRQRLRLACAEHADTLPCGYDPALRADLIIRYVLGRWHHYARSGFHKSRLSTPLHSCGCCCNSGHTCAAYVSGTISFILVGHKLSSARRFADSIAGARTQAVQYKSG